MMMKEPSAPPAPPITGAVSYAVISAEELVPILSAEPVEGISASNQRHSNGNYNNNIQPNIVAPAPEYVHLSQQNNNNNNSSTSTGNSNSNSNPFGALSDQSLSLVRRSLMLPALLGLVELVLASLALLQVGGEYVSLVVIAALGVGAFIVGFVSLPKYHQGYYDYRSRGAAMVLIGLLSSILAAILFREFSKVQACAATLRIGSYRFYGDADYHENAQMCAQHHASIGDCSCVTTKLTCITVVDLVNCSSLLESVPTLTSLLYVVSIFHMVMSFVFFVFYAFFVSPTSVPFVVLPVAPTPATRVTVDYGSNNVRGITDNSYYPGSFRHSEQSPFVDSNHHHVVELPVTNHHHSPHLVLFENHHNSFGSHHGSGHHSNHHDVHHGW